MVGVTLYTFGTRASRVTPDLCFAWLVIPTGTDSLVKRARDRKLAARSISHGRLRIILATRASLARSGSKESNPLPGWSISRKDPPFFVRRARSSQGREGSGKKERAFQLISHVKHSRLLMTIISCTCLARARELHD